MKIGDAASRTQLPSKTVRYYADIGLVTPQRHSENGYRDYDDKAISKLIFVRRAREFGFSIEDCRQLLGLYENRNRSSRDVKELTLQHLDNIEQKMRELQSLHDELSHLAKACNGDERPDCPIISGLSG